MVCAHCQKDVPSVLQGIWPTCAACGRLRMPLAGESVQNVGRGRTIAGTLAKAGAFAIAMSGVFLAAAFALLGSVLLRRLGIDPGSSNLIVGAITFAWASFMLVVSVAIWTLGKGLHRSAENARYLAHKLAMESVLKKQPLTIQAISQRLRLPEPEVEVQIARWMQEDPDALSMDLLDSGAIVYRPSL